MANENDAETRDTDAMDNALLVRVVDENGDEVTEERLEPGAEPGTEWDLYQSMILTAYNGETVQLIDKGLIIEETQV